MRFSIIIPSYNRAHLITRTIESVFAQNYQDWELIIIDDGSTDDTESVVLQFNDQRLHYRQVENGERARARNIGSSLAKGDYIYFLDSDDLLYPQHLSTAEKYLKSSQGDILWLPYEVVNSDMKVLNPAPKIDRPVLDELVQNGNFLSCHGVFLRKEIALENPFNEDRDLSGSEDMELWIRLACEYRFEIGKEVTSALVEHEERSVMNFDDVVPLISRKEKMLSYLLNNEKVRERIGKKANTLRSRAYSYIALHAALNRNSSALTACRYMTKAIGLDLKQLLDKRILAICKHLALRTIGR